MLSISLPEDSAFFDQRVELDGTPYVLDFSWNGRAETWYLSIADTDGVVLASGIAIVSDALLLRRYKYDARMPGGDLIAVDLTRTIDAPGYGQLGTTVPLYYITAAEIAGRE